MGRRRRAVRHGRRQAEPQRQCGPARLRDAISGTVFRPGGAAGQAADRRLPGHGAVRRQDVRTGRPDAQRRAVGHAQRARLHVRRLPARGCAQPDRDDPAARRCAAARRPAARQRHAAVAARRRRTGRRGSGRRRPGRHAGPDGHAQRGRRRRHRLHAVAAAAAIERQRRRQLRGQPGSRQRRAAPQSRRRHQPDRRGRQLFPRHAGRAAGVPDVVRPRWHDHQRQHPAQGGTDGGPGHAAAAQRARSQLAAHPGAHARAELYRHLVLPRLDGLPAAGEQSQREVAL